MIEHGIGGRVVVHLHLTIDLHVLAARLNIVEQLTNGGGEVALLLQEHVELRLALCNVLGTGIGALCLLPHVVNLQGEDAQAIKGPSRALGIERGLGEHLHIAIELTEVGVDLLHQVRAVLIAAVDATLEAHAIDGADMGIANQILKMPLYGIDPALQIEAVLYRVALVGVMDRRIDIVGDVIITNGLIENLVAMCYK